MTTMDRIRHAQQWASKGYLERFGPALLQLRQFVDSVEQRISLEELRRTEVRCMALNVLDAQQAMERYQQRTGDETL